MNKDDWLILMAAAYVALCILLLFANWRRKQLLRWCTEEARRLEREADELRIQKKTLIQQHEWDSMKDHPGNRLVLEFYHRRLDDYNARRVRLIQTTKLLSQLFPW